MSNISRESIWSSVVAVRQLTANYYTLSTCLTDLLHRYCETTSSSSHNDRLSANLFHNLDLTLFSTSTTSLNQAKLLDEYTNVLLNILKQNTLHTNILQNVRRLFRYDAYLKSLFSSESNERCVCHECDCTISNSITDVIHDVGEIRQNILIDSTSVSCVCFRCGDQNQTKTVSFKTFSPCLALVVNRLNINAIDQLTNAQNITYELCYVIELDSRLRSIINVYLREDSHFVKVDGDDTSTRSSTINGQGKFLTLWLSRTVPSKAACEKIDELVSIPHHDAFLSPPQSSSSSSQIIVNSQVHNESTASTECANTLNFDDLLPSATTATTDPIPDDEDDHFWSSLHERSTTIEHEQTPTTNDAVSDIYLTLLHTTAKDTTPIKSRAEHDRTVNTLATDILWPLIVDQTNRRQEKRVSSSSSSTTTTVQSISSRSSMMSSASQRNHPYKQLPLKTTRRSHPYAKVIDNS